MICTNCGKRYSLEARVGDAERLPYAEDGTVGCVWAKNARHPCGGVYDISDYHRTRVST